MQRISSSESWLGNFLSFWRKESAAVTVEFVIILPILLIILLLIVSSALLFAAASDVQQLAHELARAGIWVFLEGSADLAASCTRLTQQSLQPIIEGLPTLYIDGVRRVDCFFPTDFYASKSNTICATISDSFWGELSD